MTIKKSYKLSWFFINKYLLLIFKKYIQKISVWYYGYFILM